MSKKVSKMSKTTSMIERVQEDRALVSRASGLVERAAQAAMAAATSERAARQVENEHEVSAGVRRLSLELADAVDAADAAAREAREAGRVGDVAGASLAAERAAASARQAASLAVDLRVMGSAASAQRTTKRGRAKAQEVHVASQAERDAQSIAQFVDRSARYLVIRDYQLLASFVSEDDALLFEAELADLDLARGASSVLCEVRERGGRRVGGYLITAGKLVSFLRDRDFERRYSGVRRS